MTVTTPRTAPPGDRWRDVDGILLLDKPEGITSNAALQRVRRLFRARKAGHTGSLDPLASGLLPVCFGQATKVSGFLLDADKTYRFELALGARTATGDREGPVVETATVPELDEGAVREAATGFLGETQQVPPMHSALKHEGERLYRLARRGVEVERAARRVVIHRLDLLGIGKDSLLFELRCSKGTYVRTLAEDLARAIGTVGHVHCLRRTGLGPFTGAGLQTLASLESESRDEAVLDSRLLPTDAALPELPVVRLGIAEQACVLQGAMVFVTAPGSARVRMYGPEGRFLGVGRVTPEGGRLAPERLMVTVSG